MKLQYFSDSSAKASAGLIKKKRRTRGRIVKRHSRATWPALSTLEGRILLCGPEAITVPGLPSIVAVQPNDRRVFVQQRNPDGTLSSPAALVMVGVNWSPDSIGTPSANVTGEFAKWYKTDIPLMAKMGVNVVRVYHDFGTGPDAFAILDEFYRYNIKVIMTVDSPRQGDVGDAANITSIVKAYENHPAILMWDIGNEWDLNNYNGQYPDLTSATMATEEFALLIKSLDPNHPVASSIADPDIFTVHPLSPSFSPYALARPYTSDMVNTLAPDVDVWGIQVYRGAMFGDVFNEWASISTKPMFVGEFGADSYDHRSGGENQPMQAQFDASLSDEDYLNLSAERTTGTSLGALAFEWNDEWWKNGDPNTHNISGETNGGQPDDYNDEEWFGLVDINRKPKTVYVTLQQRFLTGLSAVTLDAHPTIQVTSQFGGNGIEFQIDGKTAFLRFGAQYGGRGISVAVLDPATGVRMTNVSTFDTWLGFYTQGPHTGFASLVNYLNGLPDGTIYAMGIADEGGFVHSDNSPWSDPLVQDAVATLKSLGSTQVQNIVYNGGWAMIGKKGQGVLAEGVSSSFQPITIQAQANLSPNPNQGMRADLSAPVLSSIADQTIAEGSKLCFTATANSTNNGPTTFAYSLDPGAPPGTSIDPNTGEFDWTPSEGPATVSVTIRVTNKDAQSLTDTRTFKINVLNVAPSVAAGPDATVKQGDTLTRTGSFTDPGADTWTATVNYGDGSSVQPLPLNPNKTFSLSHAYPRFGSYRVQTVVTDQNGGSGSGSFQVKVTVNATADYNGDGKSDIGVYGPYGPGGIGRIAVLESGGGVINMPFGGPLDKAVVGDFDGDGKTDIAVYGPYGPGGVGRLAVLESGGGAINIPFGGPLDHFVSGDFNSDGKTDIAVYGPYGPNGMNRLAVLESGGGVINMPFGGPHDTFVAGDFDGDGKTDIAVYGPYGPNGLNRLAALLSSGGTMVETIGGPLDQPVAGDFNGDGKSDFGVYGPYGANGLNRLAVLLSGGGAIVQTIGGPLDRFVSADFDGDGKTDIAVYGPYGPGGIGRLAVLESGGGAINMPIGGPLDTPLPPPVQRPNVTATASRSASALVQAPSRPARSRAFLNPPTPRALSLVLIPFPSPESSSMPAVVTASFKHQRARRVYDLALEAYAEEKLF
jgi:hypothetical protein